MKPLPKAKTAASALDYKRVKSRQRYLDQQTREQRRMPLHMTPLMSLDAARRLNTEFSLAALKRHESQNLKAGIISDVPF